MQKESVASECIWQSRIKPAWTIIPDLIKLVLPRTDSSVTGKEGEGKLQQDLLLLVVSRWLDVTLQWRTHSSFIPLYQTVCFCHLPHKVVPAPWSQRSGEEVDLGSLLITILCEGIREVVGSARHLAGDRVPDLSLWNKWKMVSKLDFQVLSRGSVDGFSFTHWMTISQIGLFIASPMYMYRYFAVPKILFTLFSPTGNNPLFFHVPFSF